MDERKASNPEYPKPRLPPRQRVSRWANTAGTSGRMLFEMGGRHAPEIPQSAFWSSGRGQLGQSIATMKQLESEYTRTVDENAFLSSSRLEELRSQTLRIVSSPTKNAMIMALAAA